MIFINKEQKTIHIPRHNKTESEELTLTLKLKHNLTGTQIEFIDLKDYGFKTAYFAFYGLDFTNMQSGEYNYYLCNDIAQLECGLLNVDNENKEVISYKKESNKLIYNG